MNMEVFLEGGAVICFKPLAARRFSCGGYMGCPKMPSPLECNSPTPQLIVVRDHFLASTETKIYIMHPNNAEYNINYNNA